MNFLPYTAFDPKGFLDSKVIEACKHLEKVTGSRCFLFITDEIDEDTYKAIYHHRKELGRGDNLSMVVFSYGGDPHAAYKIMKLIRRRYKHLAIFVPYKAKSAATFMCLGADEIVLAEQGELGPLDAQHPSPSDPEKLISALESFKTLESIRGFAVETFNVVLKHFVFRSGFTVMEALPHVTRFVGTIIDPLFRNFDVHKLGDYGRSLEIAYDYGLRLMEKYGYKDKKQLESIKILTKLVWGYPAHERVLDFDECQELGLKVRRAKKTEEKSLQQISDNCDNVAYVGTLPKETQNVQSKTKGKGKAKAAKSKTKGKTKGNNQGGK